jgi:neutral ceramidase
MLTYIAKFDLRTYSWYLIITKLYLQSIERAHNNMKQGNIYVNSGELLESNINRSPTAYLYNPPEERAR